VIYHKAEDGALLEPYEEVHIETSAETVGVVVEMLGSRRGRMMEMQDAGQGMTRIVYIVPTRGLLGFRYQFLTSTRGAGIMHTIFNGYDEIRPDRFTPERVHCCLGGRRDHCLRT
jgi:GTP-binding protein